MNPLFNSVTKLQSVIIFLISILSSMQKIKHRYIYSGFSLPINIAPKCFIWRGKVCSKSPTCETGIFFVPVFRRHFYSVAERLIFLITLSYLSVYIIFFFCENLPHFGGFPLLQIFYRKFSLLFRKFFIAHPQHTKPEILKFFSSIF